MDDTDDPHVGHDVERDSCTHIGDAFSHFRDIKNAAKAAKAAQTEEGNHSCEGGAGKYKKGRAIGHHAQVQIRSTNGELKAEAGVTRKNQKGTPRLHATK